MRLEPVYRLRFTYPEGWAIQLSGSWEQHFYVVEEQCEGAFRGANFPQRREDRTFRPDFRAVIETDDGATIMVEWHGYRRAYPVGRQQIVGALFHFSDDERYRRLNDVACVSVGEVRAREGEGSDLVADVGERFWEPIAE